MSINQAEANKPMIAHISSPDQSNPGTPIYHLHIALEDHEPCIWRRLQVPGNANLGWLHAVFQVAMGWTNSHLHLFQLGNQTYSDPAFELDEDAECPPVHDEHVALLMILATHKGHTLPYKYDFGDSWKHRVTVVDILPPDTASAKSARCLDGAGACPPEDCGGVSGYAELLKILKNPKNRQHKAMKAWLGRPFDPAGFDLEKVNACLGRLRWPRVTETQLAKVLMARDE